ncbi:MAG: DHA2 family efflux MFS transporter permease subunit [Candidatus Tectomicrobia bacterium]|nr:DHA2 family efflux MFS transporter permease subunit [Candidatus Tectomicrobia bacterium]
MTNSADDQVRWGAVISVLLGIVAFAFSNATLNISIPRIMVDLSVDVDSIQWVASGFDIAQTVAMPTVGWLGGIFGNRNLFLTGISISLVGASLAGLSWSLESLIVFQVLQGLGAGLMQPTLTAILYGLFPIHRRGLAVALTMTAFGLGPTIGPIAAGYLVEHVSWRATFYVQIPIGLACIILTLSTMRNVIETRLQRIDVAGLITMSLFLVSLFLALNQGRREGWNSPYIMSLFTLSVLSFVLFVIIELSIESPVVNLHLYANIPFTMGCLVTFLNTMVFRGSGFLMAVLVQNTLKYSPIPAGYMRAPSGFSFGVLSYFAGKLSDRFGPKVPIMIGMIVFIWTFFWYANMTRWNTTAFVIVQVMVFLPIAYGLTNSPSNFAALQALPESSVRMGSGLFSLVRGVSSAFGVAMSATLLERQRHIHFMRFSEDAGRAANSLPDTLAGLQRHATPFGADATSASLSLAALVRYMSEEAVFAAYQDLFIMGGVLSVITLIPVFLLATRKRSAS